MGLKPPTGNDLQSLKKRLPMNTAVVWMRLAIFELLGAADCWYGSADFRSLMMIRSADFRMGAS